MDKKLPGEPDSSQAKRRDDQCYNFDLQTLNFYLYNSCAVQIVDVTNLKRPTENVKDKEELQPNKQVAADHHGPRLTNAIRSFPDQVQLCSSSIPGAGYGVCAKQHIPVGTWIGPYEGRLVDAAALLPDTDTSHLWEIFKGGTLSHYIDGIDEDTSSWMRFIRCARHIHEQNLYAFQYHGNIFYRAFKEIEPGKELLVWYDEKYPDFIGYARCMQDYETVKDSAHTWNSFDLNSTQDLMNCNPRGSCKSDGAGNFKQPTSSTFQTGSLHTKNSQHGRLNPHNENTTLSSERTSKTEKRRTNVRSYSLDGGHTSSSPSERASIHYMPRLSHKVNLKDNEKLSNQEAEPVLRKTTRVCHLSGARKAVASQEESRSFPFVHKEERSNAVQTETSLSGAGSFYAARHQIPHVTFVENAATQYQAERGRNVPHSSYLPHIPVLMTKDFKPQYSQESESRTSGIASDEFSMWRCRQCLKTFTQRVLLQLHICPETPKKPYQCGHCALSFATPSDLRNHVDTHTNDKLFKCGFCSRSFSGPTTLNNHIRTHTGEKPFICDKCGICFSQASHLARHQKECSS